MGRSLLGRKEDRHRREAAEVVGKPRRRAVSLGAKMTEGRLAMLWMSRTSKVEGKTGRIGM